MHSELSHYHFIFCILQLLPLLASALEFGSAAAPALTALLKMGSWLSTEEFSAKVIFWFSLSAAFYFALTGISPFSLLLLFIGIANNSQLTLNSMLILAPKVLFFVLCDILLTIRDIFLYYYDLLNLVNIVIN